MVRTESHIRKVALIGLASAALAASGGQAGAVSGRVACLTRSRSDVNLGPCTTPDAIDYFSAGPQKAPLVVTNFGLLLPGDRSATWQVICDDNFGLPKPPQIRMHPDGRIFSPSLAGLFISSDGCSWTHSADIADRALFDLAMDRTGTDVYALGDIPRKLWHSADAGKTFTLLKTFLDTQPFGRVVVSPVDSKRIYLIGRGRANSTPFARSRDGGQTFEFVDLATTANPPPGQALDFVAASPDDAGTLYFSVINATDGDELWRTTDGGVTVSMVLRMTDALAFSGFAFGATSQTMYVAGSDPFPLPNVPPAKLYVSKDGGKTWAAPIASGQEGPRFRCLSYTGGKLYACAAGEPGGDQFLIGVSSDEGKTWGPAVKLGQVSGAKTCVQPICVKTEEWLCDNYCYCAPGTQPSSGACISPGVGGAVPDGGAPAPDAGPDVLPMGNSCVGTACKEKQGWACTVGARETRPGVAALLWLSLLVLVRRRRRHARR